MVVKVQLPLQGGDEMLVYNEDRSVLAILPFDENVGAWIEDAGREGIFRFKAFFEARVEGTRLHLDRLLEPEEVKRREREGCRHRSRTARGSH